MSNIKKSTDTIILTQNINPITYEKVRYQYTVNIEPYICKRVTSNTNKGIGLEFRHKDYEINFMHIDIKELPYRKNLFLKITIHLNHFIQQAFPNNNYVNPNEIIDELQWIISKYLRFPGFELDRMRVSRIDIAMDFKLKHDPSHYLSILRHKTIPRYLLHYNNGNSTLSIHSYSLTDTINSDYDTPNKGTIYNKSKKMGLEENIIRFEFKLNGNQKNQLPLMTYTDEGYYDISNEKNGVTKFSDIFSADIGSALHKRFIENVLLKDDNILESNESVEDYLSENSDSIDRFIDADDYYKQLIPLLRIRKRITDRIKNKCILWAEKQMNSDIPIDKKNEIWNLIQENLIDKFRYQLNQLDTPLEDTLLELKEYFIDLDVIRFIDLIGNKIPLKKDDRVDQADESTRKVVISYFKEQFNDQFAEWKKEEKKDINKQIKSLRDEYKIYSNCNLLQKLSEDFEGVKGQDLYDELRMLAESYNNNHTENVFNLYKIYNLLSNFLSFQKKNLVA